MQRIFIAGLALVFCGALIARSKNDPLVFVFMRVDTAQDLAILRPMIAPDIGVQLDSGPRILQTGTVLQCESAARSHPAIVEGQVAQITDVLLDCGDQKFVVKTLDFTPRRK
jgi:hypothetical protein